MPVAMLVIVPTSRGVSCGVNASRAWPNSGKRAVEDTLQAFRLGDHGCFVSGLGSFGLDARFGLGLRRLVLGFRLWLGFRFRFVLFFQKLTDALFQRREVIRDAPGYFLSIRGEFDPADQVRRGLEPDVNFGREGLVERILDCRALRRRQVKRAAHERGLGRCLEGLAEALFCLAVHRCAGDG